MMSKNKIISTLYDLYDEKDKLGCEKLAESLTALKVNSLVNYYIYNEKEQTEQDTEIIGMIIKLLQFIYNNSDVTPPITDELYDQLYATMISDGSPDIVGADVGSDRVKIYHQYPDLRGTLNKVHFFNNVEKSKNEKRQSICDWMISIENRIGRHMTKEEGEITVFPKFDGVSVIFECDKNGKVERALTRGNTEKNEACEIPLLSGMTFRPNDEWRGSPFGIKTEVIMRYSSFKKFCKKYGSLKSPRSAVSSIINSQSPKIDFLRYITIVPLRMQNFMTNEIIIHPDAYSVYPHVTGYINNTAEIASLKDKFNGLRDYMAEAMEVPCDGVVLYLNDCNMRKTLGRDDVDGINRFEVAYKFPPLAVKTTLLDVDFSIGLLGTISPVAKIEPVTMHGNTIKSVSLGSMDRFESLGLHYGDEVLVKYEIIPYLDKTPDCKESDGDLIKSPTHCSYCGEELIRDPLLKCTNDECPCRMIGSIVNYLNKMDIMNISEATVTTLFNMGVLTSIEDLYKLNKHRNKIIESAGFGDKSFEKILKGIKARKKVKDYDLLGALGIPDVGAKKFKPIMFIYYIDELMEICYTGDIKKLTKIQGIGEKTATNIIIGIMKHEELIEFLRKELEVIETKGVDTTTSVLFSKVKDNKDFEKFLSDKGIDIASGYNKNISLLVVPSLAETSNKIEAAKKDGKEIITIEDAYKRFGYNQ